MEKNKAQRNKAVQWTAMWFLALWGFMSFLVLAGEDDPYDPMPFRRFCLLKGVAMASLLLCMYVGKKLHKAGYLPDELDDED